MASKPENIELYKKLICDMIQDINDGRFLRQVYAYIFRDRRACSRLQQELHGMIEDMDAEDLRLLWVAAKELKK